MYTKSIYFHYQALGEVALFLPFSLSLSLPFFIIFFASVYAGLSILKLFFNFFFWLIFLKSNCIICNILFYKIHKIKMWALFTMLHAHRIHIHLKWFQFLVLILIVSLMQFAMCHFWHMANWVNETINITIYIVINIIQVSLFFFFPISKQQSYSGVIVIPLFL